MIIEITEVLFFQFEFYYAHDRIRKETFISHIAIRFWSFSFFTNEQGRSPRAGLGKKISFFNSEFWIFDHRVDSRCTFNKKTGRQVKNFIYAGCNLIYH